MIDCNNNSLNKNTDVLYKNNLFSIVDFDLINNLVKIYSYNTFETHLVNSKYLEKIFSWKEMAEMAIDVQNACNISGIVHSFSKIFPSIRKRLEIEGRGGNVNINNNEIVILFSDKIKSLSGDDYSRAYNWATNFVKK